MFLCLSRCIFSLCPVEDVRTADAERVISSAQISSAKLADSGRIRAPDASGRETMA